MEKALKMGKVSATGSFQLFVGVATSSVFFVMAVGTMILARLLSRAEYGLYSVALIPSLMINLFRDWGVNSAMTKYVAHFGAAKKEENIRHIIAGGLIFEIPIGPFLSLLSVFLAHALEIIRKDICGINHRSCNHICLRKFPQHS